MRPEVRQLAKATVGQEFITNISAAITSLASIGAGTPATPLAATERSI
jgi:hypothetical protein